MRSVTQITTALIVVLTPILAATQTAERGRTQGIKETDRFIKAGAATTQKVAEAKNQVKGTLDAYNALISTSKNMKSDYKKLMKSSDSMNDKLTEARQKIAEMQKAGAIYFNGRAENLKGIQDAELQNQSKQRMEDSQKEFSSVLLGLAEAGDALEPFEKQLADQIVYLGSDLTPSATASLQPNAEKLNRQGGEVFVKADEAIGRADAYFQGLRAVQS